MGVNPTHYKVVAFTMSAMLAGVVGAISAHFINTWNSRQGTFDTSVNLMAFVLVASLAAKALLARSRRKLVG